MDTTVRNRSHHRSLVAAILVSATAGISLLLVGARTYASGGQFAVTNVSNVVSRSVQPCTPVSFGAPAQLDLTDAADGATIQTAQPTRYQIYGNTAADLRAQIQSCGPHSSSTADAEFTAQTSYNLSWQYNIVNAGSSCSLTDVKVGLHIAMVLPYWQAGTNATTGLPGRWQQFEANLLTHENGHAAIDKSYATQLATNLTSIQDIPCGDVSATVNATSDAGSAALNHANNAYDARTNHGATQGAVLPTY